MFLLSFNSTIFFTSFLISSLTHPSFSSVSCKIHKFVQLLETLLLHCDQIGYTELFHTYLICFVFLYVVYFRDACMEWWIKYTFSSVWVEYSIDNVRSIWCMMSFNSFKYSKIHMGTQKNQDKFKQIHFICFIFLVQTPCLWGRVGFYWVGVNLCLKTHGYTFYETGCIRVCNICLLL